MNRHYQPDPDLGAFIHALPKTETHLHLEGSVSFDQLRDFDPVRYPEPPPFWDSDFRYDGFNHFQAMFNEWIVPYHTSIEHYQETARRVFANCQEQGCRYVEASFHLPSVAWIKGDGIDLLAGILEVVPEGLEVRLFGGMMHTDYGQHGDLLEQALGWESLTGIDLHGPEDWPVDDEIPGLWKRAQSAGKVTKAHAGEFMPAAFVEWVVDRLEVQRVQHGVRAIESPAVMEKLAERGVVLDVCPISNLKLGVEGVAAMSDHPIKRLMDAGVCTTLSTDDTFMFGNTLEEEYAALSMVLGFSRADLIGIARNGFETALLDGERRGRLLAELDLFAEAHI